MCACDGSLGNAVLADISRFQLTDFWSVSQRRTLLSTLAGNFASAGQVLEFAWFFPYLDAEKGELHAPTRY
jgi:hypothetical protein